MSATEIKTRTRTQLSPEGKAFSNALTLALGMSSFNTREELAKAAGISPLTISSMVRRATIYKDVYDALERKLAISAETAALITAALEAGNGAVLLKPFYLSSPERKSFDRAAIEKIAGVKAVFAAVVKLNKYASVKDFTETNPSFNVGFLNTGDVTADIVRELESLLSKAGKKQFSTYSALDEYITEETTETEPEEEGSL